MLITIDNILSPEEIAAASAFMAQGDFIDGSLSAGKLAKGVKHNHELAQNSDIYRRLNAVVFEKFYQNEHFQAAAMPLKMVDPFYSKYAKGMYYGAHIDNPIMGKGPFLRADVSATLFLSAPEDYANGELCIQTDAGEQKIKLAAGSAVIYPSSSLHRVTEITKGERLAMVIWCQSRTKDPAQRALLYSLWQSREQLLSENPTATTTQRIDQTYANLVRMWADV